MIASMRSGRSRLDPKRIHRVFSCLALISLVSGQARGESLADVRQIHEEHFNLIRSGTITYILTEEQYPTEEESRERAEKRREKRQAMAQEMMDRHKESSEKVRRQIEEQAARLLAEPPAATVVEPDIKRIQVWFDRDSDQKRREMTPLNSLGVPKEDQSDPSNRTQFRVSGPKSFIQYVDRCGSAVIFPRHSRSGNQSSAATWGALDPNYFSDFSASGEIEKAQIEGHAVDVCSLTSPDSDKWKIVLCVDPTVGYRFRLLETYLQGNLFRRVTASDYRLVNDIPFPFHSEETFFRPEDGTVAERTTYEVLDVEFNQAVPPETFELQLPDYARIVDTVRAPGP